MLSSSCWSASKCPYIRCPDRQMGCDLDGRGRDWQHWIAALPLSGAVRALIPGGELSALYDLCRRENWLITLEAAASEIKAKFAVFGNEPESLPLLRALKQRFDADGTLAPGRDLGGL